MARPMVQAPVPSTSLATPSVGDSEAGGLRRLHRVCPSYVTLWSQADAGWRAWG